MSQSLHVCKICGKWFATAQAVYGHQRMHSGLQQIWRFKKPRVSSSVESETLDPLRRGYKAASSLTLKKSSSFMTEIEEHDMNEAAMSLVMLSKRASVIRDLPPGDIAMDLEKIRQFVDQSKQEFSGVSTTCSDDVVAQALPSPLRSSKSQMKCESNFSYRIKICGKSFERSLGGRQTLHRSNRGQLARKKEEFEVGHSLPVLADSAAKKVVPQPSCFEVSQEDLIERRDTTVKEHCIEPKQDFSEVFSHSGFEKSSSYSDAAAEALPFPLRSEFQETPETDSSYKCKVCGKNFGSFQALGGHKTLHRPISVILGRKRRRFEEDNSPSGSSEAKKIVSKPSSFEVEVSQEELIGRSRDTNVKEHSFELRQDFSEGFSHSSFEDSSSYTDAVAEALPFPLRSEFQETPESDSSYKCKVCGKFFGCFQALGGHQTLHRPISVILGGKRRRVEEGNSPYVCLI